MSWPEVVAVYLVLSAAKGVAKYALEVWRDYQERPR